MQYLYDRNNVIIKDTSQVQFQETQSFTMKAVKYNPVAGRGYQLRPPLLARKKSVLIIRTSNEKCFGYSISAYLLILEGETILCEETKGNSR